MRKFPSLRTGKYVAQGAHASMGALRNCFKTAIVDLQETTGTHRAWRTIKDPNNEGKWPYYQLPEIKPVSQKR